MGLNRFKPTSTCLCHQVSPACVHLPRYHQKASDVQQEARSSKDERAVAETRSNPAGSKVVWKHARHRSREDAAIPSSSEGKLLAQKVEKK